MRINLKYFILILLLDGCKGNTKQAIQKDLILYPEPVTVAVNTSEGYALNKVTGDTIKVLLNSFGDTVRTGIPIPFKGKMVDPEKKLNPKIQRAGLGYKVTITSNLHLIPDKLDFVLVDSSRLKKIKNGEGNRSFILTNSNGVIPTGVPIPVKGKKMAFHQPYPVKALPLRYKDIASANIQILDVDQGMSSSYVFSILEDKKGNLWFGTDGAGISKYDGVGFTHFTEKEGLSNNIIRSIIEDRNGNLWFGAAGGGINKYDGQNFTQYTEKEGLPNNNIGSILEDKNGNLWFGTDGGGVSKYDGANFTHFTEKEGLSSNRVSSMLEDKNGYLWFGTDGGVTKFDGENFTHFTRKEGLTSNLVLSMLEDKNGNLWFGTDGGINKYDGVKFTNYTVKEGLSSNLVSSIIEDRNGNLWFGTIGGGINKYDGVKFTHYTVKEGLSNNRINSIIEDRNGSLWFGTYGGGVNKLNDGSFMNFIENEVLANNKVRPIIEDKNGNLWFGTDGGGVGKFDGENFINYTIKDGLSGNGVRSILEDKNGNLWFGTDGGVSKYDGANFTNYTEKEGLSNIRSIIEDRNGNLWFGTYGGGVSKYNGKNFTHYTEKEGLSSNRVLSILEDKNGHLWFGTDGGGVSKYDGANITHYTEKEGLSNNRVTSLFEDKNGHLWMGTIGGGVCMYDEKSLPDGKKGFTYYTEREGLTNNEVWSIFEDKNRDLWFGTDKGLTLFIPNEDTYSGLNRKNFKTKYAIYRFGLQDGLKAIDFNLKSVCQDNKNRIWWGTGKGLITLDVNKTFQTYDTPSMQLSYIEINDRFYDYRNLSDSINKEISFSNVAAFYNYPNELKLSHELNHLTFHYSAIDWSYPHKIKYTYRLVGLDERWSNPAEEAIADYRNLNHGKYEFQVRAIGQSQVWSETVTYNFVIWPPWWQTWWFKALIIFTSVALAFLITRFIYMTQLRKQRVILEKKLAIQYERQRISSEMHDDIGAGLSGIRLMTEMAKMKSKDQNSVTEIEKIYQSVGDISSKMKEVIWSLNTENDSLSSLISYLQNQARLMLENYPCKFTMTVPDNIPDLKISGDKRRNIYLILKEALHNIIKHSGADKVELTINCEDSLRLVVSDNGKGMGDADKQMAGNGLRNMKQRILTLNGKFIIQNQQGTTLVFEIPLKEDK